MVFITGHIQQGIRGYDIGAVDYLAKPVSRENLQRAVDRIKTILKLRGIGHKTGGDNRLVVKNGRDVYLSIPTRCYSWKRLTG